MENKRTHYKSLMNPNYIGAFAFQPGEIKTGTIKTTGVEIVQNPKGEKEECLVIHFEEDLLPMIVNKTNCKTIEKLYGTPYIEDWAGKKIQLHVKKVSAFGDTVDAVRVMNSMPGSEPICECCHRIIKPGAGKSAKELAEIALKHAGKKLCLECQRKYKEEHR